MRRNGLAVLTAIAFAALVGVAGSAAAVDCPGCEIGLFDDAALTRRTGSGTGLVKEVYVGITFASGADSTFTGVEFSVAGLDSFRATFAPSGDPAIVLGTLETPAGLDTLFGNGGLNMAWAECRTGRQVLGKIFLQARTVWPTAPATFRVTRRYPPSNPQIRAPLLTRCDNPVFSPARVAGGEYVLNGNGVVLCNVNIDRDDFGSIVVGDSAFAHMTIRNSGNDALQGTLSSPCSDFVIMDERPSYSIAPGGLRTFRVAFVPSTVGVQVCSLQVGAACGTFPVRGRSQLTDLNALRASPNTYVGRRVRVEGQVFVPGDHDPAQPGAWILGAGGRGISVTGAGALDPLLADTRNVVQITGTVRAPLGAGYYTLADVTSVDRVRTATPLEPADLSAQALLEPVRFGSYVRVRGHIDGHETTATGTRYRASDNTGSFAVLVAGALGADSLITGEAYAIAGALEGGNPPVLEVGAASAITTVSGASECALSISRTNLGNVAFGDTAFADVTVSNVGLGRLTGSVALECAGFAIRGAAEFDLGFTEAHRFRVAFSPVELGEQSCVVRITAACDSVVLTARSALVAIADIRRNPASFDGKRLQVQGQVFVPGDHNPSQPAAWIMGSDDRGLPVIGAAALDPRFADVHNVVRVTGVVTRPTPSTVAIRDVANVLVVRTAEPLRPLLLTAAQLADSTLAGSFVEVRVQSQGLIHSDPDQALYGALDATGAIRFIVPTAFGAPALPLGTSVHVQGALEGGSPPLVHPGTRTDVVDEHPGCRGALLTVSEAAGAPGDTVTVRIGCAWNQTPIDAWGVRLTYDPTVLRFVSAECCGLASGWQNCGAGVIAPGVLTLGGFNADPIAAFQAGDLACLRFEMLRCTQRTLIAATERTDDIVNLAACDGVVQCSVCASDGDVNRDAALSPGDAQCAFDIYLANQQVPEGCTASDECGNTAADVDCNGTVTPSDALRIFTRWLDGNTAPEDCFAREIQRISTADEPAFRLGTPRSEGGVTVVPVETRAPRSNAAVGLEFTLPGVTGVHFVRTDAGLRWNKLAASAVAGRIRCGGYFADRTRAPMDDQWTVLGELRLDGNPSNFDPNSVQWDDRLVLTAAAPVANGAWLARITNPVVGGGAAITLQVPPGGAGAASVQILDVRGRIVNTLFSGALAGGTRRFTWNLTNGAGTHVAAGLYVVRFRSGTRSETRKIAVMR